MSDRTLASGWGRVLIFGYGLFAVAATGRSVLQLVSHPERAPLAYGLSVLAAVIYLFATACLVAGGRPAWAMAAVACSIELLGVITVGALSYGAPGLFPDKTVWSHFGQGYGYVPLVLPVAGLAWLRHSRPSPGPGKGHLA